ncbi:MAG: response regulator [Chloroflexi bacterium]|nr:response regulator [Chloroflexota bacterium]
MALTQSLYFTPASIGYLTQLILSLGITLYLFSRARGGSVQTRLLAAFFASVTIFVGLLFFDAASLPGPRLYAVYLENTVLGVALVFLLQFIYRYPEQFPARRWGSLLAFSLSAAYTLYELQYAIYRYSLLLQHDTVDYRPPIADYALAAMFAWVLAAFLLQTVAADPRPVAWWHKLWKPQGVGAHSTRLFALIFSPLFMLAIVNILQTESVISATTYNASLSVGILVTLFLFASAYLNFLPESTSFLEKLSGGTLTLLLMVLGLAGWVVSPAAIAAYQPVLTDHQTLRYTPNTQGGYDVAVIPFYFETDLGERVDVTSFGDSRNHMLGFAFPFYGKTYQQVSVTSVGVISMGRELQHPNLQYEYGRFPGIFALLVDLDPAAGGGVYTRVDGDRLIVTWDHLPEENHHKAVYTFQAVLRGDGSFDVTYNGLATPIPFDPDADPSANPWLRGVTPGLSAPVEQVADLSASIQSGPNGVVQDIHQDFRVHLDRFARPLAWLVLASSLLLLVTLPLTIHSSIVRPLRELLDGAGKVEGGDLNVEMPIRFNDEIGSLTNSFNSMVLHLRSLVTMLEDRVAERTRELQAANERLLIEIDERAAAEAQIIQQQRDLAVVEEREQLGRELHDGFGQVIGFVNVQAQAAQAFLERNQVPAAQENLERIVRAAQDAHIDLRHYILGLRDPAKPQQGFYGVLQESLRVFSQAWNIETIFSPSQNTLPLLPETVEDQLLHIVQEALVNVRKHAAARRVEVLITSLANEIVFIVSDDGRGFDPQHAPGVGEKRFGLSIMRERAEQVGGRLEIRSAAGQGTRVLIHVPRVLPSSKDSKDIRGLRVLLVGDSPLFLEGVQNLLTARGLAVIGRARNGVEALELVRNLCPDMVIMDVHMSVSNGIEVTRLIRVEFPGTRVVVMTDSEEDDNLLDALRHGADGYLLKNLEANQLFMRLASVVRGESQMAPEIATRMLTEFNRSVTAPRPASFRAETVPQELTVRQWEVLRLVARGLTYKEVGAQLSLTERAIKYHMAQISERLNLKNREQIIAYVRQFQDDRRRRGPSTTLGD